MIRLTETVKCGGCAAKAPAAELARVLQHLPKQVCEQVMVGLEMPDDAGVYRLNDEVALIQTLDFFPPIVDDPYQFGQIAAANSLSDVYAMGGRPLTAMNIVCYPTDTLPREALVEMLRGGADKIAESGAILLGGHTITDDTPKFGLSVTGTAPPSDIVTTEGARPGDCLVLTKRLGTGLITTAARRRTAHPEHLSAAIASMVRLNSAASAAMVRTGVHAATDVTGFSLLGHLFEMVDQSRVSAAVRASALPLLDGALEYACAGVNTGGGRANAAHLADHVEFDPSVPEEMRLLCFDPQTSGGLLIAVPPERLDSLLGALGELDAPVAAVIGSITQGAPGTIRVVT